ncbi:MAG: hypothetical protein IPM96_17815 [Ignavibacteria bacterium]|nr:hypothetical protein [Ignavibacteria bacterium]
MKHFIKTFLVIAVIVSSFTFSSVQTTEAKSSAVTISSETQTFGLQFVRVVENNVRYIYIYTDGGIYITKIEEL